MFETTLYCHIQEVTSKQLKDQGELVAAGDHLSDDEVLAQDWDRLGSFTSHNKRRVCRESAVANLTCSVKQKLPRLVVKGPLRFPSVATVKPFTDEEGASSEQIKKKKGLLCLSVSASIHPADCMQRKPDVFDTSQLLVDESDIVGLGEIFLVEMLGDSIQDMVNARLLESQLQSTRAMFFEQNARLPSRSEVSIDKSYKSIDIVSIQSKSNGNAGGSLCNQKRILFNVDVFHFSKMMLEFMLFDIVKELHDCNKIFPPSNP